LGTLAKHTTALLGTPRAAGSMLYVLAFSLPGLLSWLWFMGPVLFPVTSALVAVGLLGGGLSGRGGLLRRLFWSVVSFACFGLNVALAVSYYTIGRSYTDSFFHHIRPDFFLAGFQEHARMLVIGAAALVTSVLSYLWLTRRAAAVPRGLPALLAVALIWPPLADLADYALTAYGYGHPGSWMVSLGHASPHRDWPMPPSVAKAGDVKLSPPKNLVVIYTESVEKAFYDLPTFAPLTPNLRRLRDGAVDFTHIRQATGVGWTIAGIVSSQCGVPLLDNLVLNPITGLSEVPFRRQATLASAVCLGDVLKANGYRTLWIAGTDLWFGGKREFLSYHGLENQIGAEEIAADFAARGKTAPRSSWGYFDSTIFGLAHEKFDEMAKGDGPFAVFMLTMDTHHPKPLPSPDCPAFDDDPLRQALGCTDRNVAAFIDAIENSPEGANTLIVVASDHVAHRTSQSEEMPPLEQRFNTFYVRGTGLPPQKMGSDGTNLDIAATILDLLGGGAQVIGAGQSLMRGPGFLAANGIIDDRGYFLSPAWCKRFIELWSPRSGQQGS
jgi:phosphoglycerol transferase